MGYAVTLKMDDASAATVTGMIARLADAGIARDQLDLGYGPHLTLAVWPGSINGLNRSAFTALAMGRPPLECILTAIAAFPGPQNALWLAPSASAPLLALQEAVCRAGPPPDPHYRARAWTPHVTLSVGIGDIGKAIAALHPLSLPLPVRFDRLEVVRFPPVSVMDSLVLGG